MPSSIQQYLNQIRTAIYGEEVRSSIVNAISECYTDVATAATAADSAAADARDAADAANLAASTADDAADAANAAAAAAAGEATKARQNIADFYSSSKQYSAGEFVIGGNELLYRFYEDFNTSRNLSWPSDFTTFLSYSVGDYVIEPENHNLAQFTTAHAAGDWNPNQVRIIANRTMTSREIRGVKNSLAETFDKSKDYAVGDYVTRGITIYRFIKDHPHGDWIGSDAINANDGLRFGTELNSIRANIATNYSPTKQYYNGDYAYKGNTLYRFNSYFNASTDLPQNIDWPDDFSTSVSYSRGDCVIRNGNLMRFITSHAAGAWNSSETETVAGVTYIGRETSWIRNCLADPFDETKSYSIGDYVFRGTAWHKFIINHTATNNWKDWNEEETITISDGLTVGGELKSIRNNINNSNFSSTRQYSGGMYTYKDGDLYRFTESFRGSWPDAFSTEQSYSKNDYVDYEGTLMRFTVNHSQGAWDSSEVIQVAGVTYTTREINGIRNSIAEPFDKTKAYSTGDYVYRGTSIQRFKVDHEADTEWDSSEVDTPSSGVTIGAELSKLASEVKNSGGGRPIIYCWGDSLTEGVGGYVMQPDNTNAYMAYSYPDWLGQTWDVVNMGARSEDCHAIMARQGADPIVLQTGFTIPASKDTPVLIGTIDHIYDITTGNGFTSKSGAMVKINKEVESAGLNPCVINGVEGIIYRENVYGYLDNNTTYNYYFKRLQNGEQTVVASGTEVETYAMRYCRNGVAIIWMGANGGYSDLQDYIADIKAMVAYGKYSNYLIIIGREFSGNSLATIKSEFTDNDNFCHVIDLMEQLPYRGYAMAGVVANLVDTTSWVTTDPIKKNAPVLCEYISGQTGENQYGTLHFSSWGYKAIAKLINEKLLTMKLGNSGGGGGGDDPDHDEYGTLLYKLTSPRTFDGTDYLDTGIKLFDSNNKNWTMAIKWSGTPVTPHGLPANIFCCCLDGDWHGLLYRYYDNENHTQIVFANQNFYGASFGHNNIEDNYGGTNVVIITKSGTTYNAYVNSSSKAYNTSYTYSMSQQDLLNLTLIVGGRWSDVGTDVQYKTGITLSDLRIYDDALDDANCVSLYNDLHG